MKISTNWHFYFSGLDILNNDDDDDGGDNDDNNNNDNDDDKNYDNDNIMILLRLIIIITTTTKITTTMIADVDMQVIADMDVGLGADKVQNHFLKKWWFFSTKDHSIVYQDINW